MTFALAIITRSAIALVADRKLTAVGGARGFLATKVCRIETLDSYGIITYAGVGARAYSKPLELSTWLQQLLRGGNGTHEQCMVAIEHAANEQRLAHLLDAFHVFMFVGFVDGQATIWVITSEKLSPEQEEQKRALKTDFWHFPFRIPERKSTFHVAIGTGIASAQTVDPIVRRAAKHLKNSSRFPGSRRKAGAMLALANRMIADRHNDVSRECICCWSDIVKTGEHWLYDDEGSTKRDRGEQSDFIPVVSGGVDLTQVMQKILPVVHDHITAMREAKLAGQPTPAIDDTKIREAIAKVDLTPKRKF